MEDRSSRRMRNLETAMPARGLQFNENVCALISMMARSTARSNQRPDTLMQDRKPTDRRKSLATHGRTIHCGLEIVNAVLTVGGVAFEKAGAHRVILRADPARARHEPSSGIGSRCKRSRTALASQSRCWEYW